MLTKAQYMMYDEFFMTNNPRDIKDYERMMLMMSYQLLLILKVLKKSQKIL